MNSVLAACECNGSNEHLSTITSHVSCYLLSVLSTDLLTSLRYLESVSSNVDNKLLSFGNNCAALDVLVR